MPFPESVINQAWTRSGGRCECTGGCAGPHPGRCRRHLNRAAQGRAVTGGWNAYQVDPNGPDSLTNCILLCYHCGEASITYSKYLARIDH